MFPWKYHIFVNFQPFLIIWLEKRWNMKDLYVSLEISYLCQFSTSFNNLTRKNNAKNNHSLLESFTEKLIHALAHLMALHSNIFMLNSWFDISPNKWHQKWRHKKLRSIVKKAQMTTSLYQSVYFWQLGCRDFISYCFGLAKFKLNSLNLIFSRVFLHCIIVIGNSIAPFILHSTKWKKQNMYGFSYSKNMENIVLFLQVISFSINLFSFEECTFLSVWV